QGEDTALPQHARRGANRLAGRHGAVGPKIVEAHVWAAVRARQDLGVAATVGHVRELRRTLGAQWKGTHTGRRTFVGHAREQRVTWAAVGAGREGITVSTVNGVVQLAE